MKAPRSTSRFTITLAASERDALERHAHEAREPMATTAGRFIRAALADHGATLDQPPARRAGPPRRRSAKRAAPAELTDSTDALRARYPHELRHLPTDPDTYIAEQTAALATWRASLDAARAEANPREVLAFGYELRSFAAFLQDRARRGR
jgi:hypothetical protein